MATESGYLYVNAGNAWPSVSLSPTMQTSGGLISLKQTGTAFATAGSFIAGPFQVSDQPTSWFRVRATLRNTLGGFRNSHVQFYTFVAPAGPPPWSPASPAPFSDLQWKAVPRDSLDFAISNAPGLVMYLGGLFRGDGTDSQRLDQVRIDYGRDTYAKFLPPVYRKQPAAADFLDRFLGMHQSVLSGIEQEINDLPRLFDPQAAPLSDPPSWLGWLSGWLAFQLDEHWMEARSRTYLSQAFHLYGKRGTIEGLTEYLKIYAGVNAIIEEPARSVTIWPLGDANPLGFGTMLASGPLQGAVLGTTATVDQSHLTTGDSLGSALFEDVAHRFCVSVYCAELNAPDTLSLVRSVLDREKPAHTTYDLCVIEPKMRVGVQARVGIDAVIAKAGSAQAATGMQLGSGALAAHSDLCQQPEAK
jgi:phage tail-like protein